MSSTGNEGNGPQAAKPEGPAATGIPTPMRLKPPSRIQAMIIKPIALPGAGVGAGVIAASAEADPKERSPKPEDFKVHTTSLKRKPEPSVPTRNTRPRTAVDTTSKTTTTRVAPARTTLAARAGAGTRSASGGATKAVVGTRSGIAKATIVARPAVRAAGVKSVSAKTATAAKVTPPAEEAKAAAAAAKKTKRPAWDVKGRLQDLEENHYATQSQLEDSKTRLEDVTEELMQSRSQVDELLQFRDSLKVEVAVKEKENHNYAQQLSDLKDQLKDAQRKHDDEKHDLTTKHARELDNLRHELDSLKRSHETISSELKGAKEENVTLRTTISTQSTLSVNMESEMRANKLRLEQTEETVRVRDATIARLEKELEEAGIAVLNLEGKVREEETIRRKLHNTVQELKGNIRVFCRVRPPLPAEIEEKKEDVLTHISFEDSDDQVIELKQTSESASGQKMVAKSYPFSFDRVFQPGTKQLAVFDEISQLVQSALDGYNVCIFAYGQTGSGKTFTMEGPTNAAEDSEDLGMIPRAVHQIFDTATKLKEKGWTYDMEAQFLEIYNESIRDLLGSAGAEGKHEIKHHPVTGKTSVTDASTVLVTTPAEVHKVLRKASQNRAVASTNCNERSSRSHSVFTLRLTGTNSLTSETSSGILNLIDLAGSERLSSSGSTGDRLKETQAINKSLSCLGDVIYALANGDKHVPYRNSKLTYLLQGSLGGNSKTLMFVNVSPLAGSFQETLCSLRFATKVNSCQIGTAKKMIK